MSAETGTPAEQEKTIRMEAPPLMTSAMEPTQPAERIQELDVLRGFALLGILMVNMGVFAGPLYAWFVDVELWPQTYNKLAEWFIVFFFQGKFYSLFSMLFGIGFAVILLRAQQRGEAKPTRVYRRRVLVLLALGAVHAFLIWMGDILMMYALLAWPLMLFRNSQPRRLILWAVILLAIPAVLNWVMLGAVSMAQFDPEARASVEKSFAEQEAMFQRELENSYRNYGQGGYWDATRQRVTDVGMMYTFIVFFAPNVLAMFLLGVWVVRSGLLHNLRERTDFLRRAQRRGLLLGIVGNAVFLWSFETASMAVPSTTAALGATFAAFGAPALMIFYASTLVLLLQSDAWRQRLRPLAFAGRMALTNYLLQSIICTLIFYNYGLGFFGQMGPAAGIALTLAIWGAQLPLSMWWLSRFRYGPAEWTWRTLTYGQAQALR